ncbi:MAG: DMT family transporter [Hyphomicrobiales bacterium]
MKDSSLRSLGSAGWALLLVLSVLWGGSYLFIKLAVDTLPPFTIVLGRVSLAALALAIVLVMSGIGLPRGRAAWLAFLTMGILNNVIPMSLIVFSQQTISVGLASILNSMTPLFTILFAHAVTHDEQLTVQKIAGVLFGISGVVILMGPELLTNFGVSAGGEWACIGAALSYACANTFGRRFAQLRIKPMQTAFGQVAASTAIMAPLAALVDQPWAIPSLGLLPFLSILALGFLCTALAYVIYFRILERSGATAIALVTLMIPPSAILMGWLILGERILLQEFFGMALIGIGLFSANRQFDRKGKFPFSAA